MQHSDAPPDEERTAARHAFAGTLSELAVRAAADPRARKSWRSDLCRRDSRGRSSRWPTHL